MHVDDLRRRTIAAAHASDRRRTRRHRWVAGLSLMGVAALITGGAIVLTPPPGPPPLSRAESMALYRAGIEDEWMHLSAKYPDATRPDVDLVRFVGRDDYDAVTLDCLREQGVDARRDGYGVSTTVPKGAEMRYEVAWFACDVQYPLDPSVTQAYTDAELRYIYQYFVGPLSSCLIDRGYAVPDPPAFADFVDTWWTADSWSPYRDLAERNAEAFEATRAACPPMPTDLRQDDADG